jgi:riboflavin kinase / FMN adenylyltransferase
MTVFTWDMILHIADGSRPVPQLFGKGTALTIGSFDGPHIGHEALFDTVLHAGYTPGIITFTRPLAGLKNPADYKGDISTLAQRLEYLSGKGFAFAVVIDFSDEFSKIEGHAFLSVLQKCCNMKFLAEGRDFHCGYHGSTDMDDIQVLAAEKGFKVEIVAPVMYGNERVSSSRIRQDILFGDFAPVSMMLRHPYRLDCAGFNWFYKKDKSVYFFSVEKSLIQILPAEGFYDVVVIVSVSRTRKVAGSDAEASGHTYKTQLSVEPQILRLKVPADNEFSTVRTIEFIQGNIERNKNGTY